MSDLESITITCADGVHLQGHFAPASGGAPGLPVLLSPATGVKQHFYLRFVSWLAAQGHDVLVFDYRGIGLSRHGHLKHNKATLAEWGQLDQVAALDWLLQRTGRDQVLMLGHSAGGQMIGLLPNHQRVARLVGVSASTGWFRGMRLGFRLKAHLGLRCLVPLGTLVKGYGPTSAVGLGEDLPAGVARQWGQWCAAGGYATNAIRGKPEQDFHAEVRTPITVLYAEDDDIATPTTVADLLRTFPSTQKQAMRIKPASHGLKAIGHIDWFRASHQALWPMIASSLRGQG
ncbi:MAG: alpha/beta fold hydrolase [Aquabacterium sp.]|uniref:alpha/beta hydrolase family protein n=1 Tax=Aquabacterium sp. TaxID=1872578 RepID=UPI0025BA1CB5|nr:alpha/beta fold hydrolase [Aquabacterium sp.]MBI3382393.1 alpha/beta fold hydrolase [Aquabacterium sp.]